MQKQLEVAVKKFEEMEAGLRAPTKEEAVSKALASWRAEKENCDRRLQRPRETHGEIEGPTWQKGGRAKDDTIQEG